MTTKTMNNKDTVEAPERIRLVKREGRFANEWYYPDAAIMPFEKEFQYARVDPPAVPTGDRCTCGHVCPSDYERQTEEAECVHAPDCGLMRGIHVAPPAPDEADKALAQSVFAQFQHEVDEREPIMPSETQKLQEIRERRDKERHSDRPFISPTWSDIDFLLSLIDTRAPVDSQGSELAREAYDYFMGPQACGDFTCACGNAEACGVCEIRQRFERWLGGQPDESPAATQMRTACVERLGQVDRAHILSNNQDYERGFRDAIRSAQTALSSLTLDQVKQESDG